MQVLKAYDAVLVVAPGNQGNEKDAYQERWLPAALGRNDNIMITVGGVKPDGRFHDSTPLPRDENSGTITVYAQSSKVSMMWNGKEALLEGTSFAAPAVVSN